MLIEILNIIAPVFLVVAAGYATVRFGFSSAGLVDQLMKFATHIAIPCLLFRATSNLDLVAAYDWRLLLSYYSAAIGCFVLTYLIMRKIFSRRPGESVAIAFAALFSNLVLLGLPISERAWGIDSMSPNFALVSVNAPICYLLGITAMEILRADGRDFAETTRVVLNAMFRNAMMIGIGLGFIVNISGINVPGAIASAVELLARASLPVALFALGGALTRYALTKSLAPAAVVALLSLAVQPLITLLLGEHLELPRATLQSVVLMAAMAPGLNAYLFASMYDRGLDAAASTVLLSTLLSVFSVSAWLAFL